MSENDPAPDGARPLHRRRALTPRSLGIASAVVGGAAALALMFATQTAVQATSVPDTPASEPIAADSSDENAPEKAEEVAKPANVAAALDQLTGDEVEYVRFLGAQTSEFAEGRDVFGDPGLQFLSTDVAEPQKDGDGQRRLQSLYYDYATDETIAMVINVATSTVEEVSRAARSQPAPTDAETSYAWQLLLDSDIAAPLVDEYAALTGGSTLTTSSEQIDLTAHSFVADPGAIGAERCGVERCVQLLAQVDGGAYLTTSTFVVSLSTRTVITIA